MIVPAFLWVATVGAVVRANAIPVLCDVDNSLSIDPRDLERKITPRTRLIVAVHMAGAACDMEAIMAVADQRRIPVLEEFRRPRRQLSRQELGTFGRIGMFSLQSNKTPRPVKADSS